MKKILYIFILTITLLFVPDKALATNNIENNNKYELNSHNLIYTLDENNFFGNLDVVKCGDTEIPAPIPPITRLAVTFIQIAAPLVLIIMGMIDMMKAVAASDEKKLKEAQTTFVKRLVPAIAIFLVITVFELLIGVLADSEEEGKTIMKCINCMINNEESCTLIERNNNDKTDNSTSDKNSNSSTVDKNEPSIKDDAIYLTEAYHDNSKNGIRYRIYNQMDSRWKDLTYNNGSTMGKAGCHNASSAVIASAHDYNITPKELFKNSMSDINKMVHKMAGESFTCTTIDHKSSDNILSELEAGNPVIILVYGNKKNGVSKFTTSQHYMALIDYDGSKIFVGNAYSDSGHGLSGWYKKEEVLTSVRKANVCKPSQDLIDKYN